MREGGLVDVPVYPIAVFEVVVDKAIDDFKWWEEGEKVAIVILRDLSEIVANAVLTVLSTV